MKGISGLLALAMLAQNLLHRSHSFRDKKRFLQRGKRQLCQCFCPSVCLSHSVVLSLPLCLSVLLLLQQRLKNVFLNRPSLSLCARVVCPVSFFLSSFLSWPLFPTAGRMIETLVVVVVARWSERVPVGLARLFSSVDSCRRCCVFRAPAKFLLGVSRCTDLNRSRGREKTLLPR